MSDTPMVRLGWKIDICVYTRRRPRQNTVSFHLEVPHCVRRCHIHCIACVTALSSSSVRPYRQTDRRLAIMGRVTSALAGSCSRLFAARVPAYKRVRASSRECDRARNVCKRLPWLSQCKATHSKKRIRGRLTVYSLDNFCSNRIVF